ncbi:MAG: potassium channel family protein [Thermodesulfovibrionales bacterium]
MMLLLIRVYLRQLVFVPALPIRVFSLLAAILLYGTTGFLYFELPQNPDLSWSDGLWYSVVTMTTVGYGDFFPKSSAGRFFIGAPLMILGIGLLGYTLSVVAAALITAKNKEIRGMNAFQLKQHLVIFNYAGLSKIDGLISELRRDPLFGRHTGVILVDSDLEELPQELAAHGVHFVRGNPTRDETLTRAGIDTAAHAVILNRRSGDPNAETLNVAIALAIEARSRKINTVVECFDPATEELLRKAGADRIVCISRFDSHFVSQELLNPGIQEVMSELLSNAAGQQLYVTPVTLSGAASFSDLSDVCGSLGHIAVGVRRDGRSMLNTGRTFPLKTGDLAITIGPARLGPVVLT